jgi:hypothetical protein
VHGYGVINAMPPSQDATTRFKRSELVFKSKSIPHTFYHVRTDNMIHDANFSYFVSISPMEELLSLQKCRITKFLVSLL